MTPADFAAVMGNGNANRGGYGGWGGFGDGQGWWVLLLFLFAMNGGWGNNGWGNNGGGLNGAAVPYMMSESTQAAVQNGFNQQSILNGINGINSTLANGFADAAVARCNAQTTTLQALSNNQMGLCQTLNANQSGLQQTLNNNQMGLYQTLNANQNANTAAQNQLAMNLQQCCCDNARNIESLRFTVAQENCADRQAISDGLRDVIANQTANTQALINSQNQGFQAIQDKLCQLELDGVRQQLDTERRENVALQNRLQMANLAASQNAQTAAIIQDNNAQTANLIRAINPAPVPSYNVPNPYTGCCGSQGYYGCGCAG